MTTRMLTHFSLAFGLAPVLGGCASEPGELTPSNLAADDVAVAVGPIRGTIVTEDTYGVPRAPCSAVALSDYWVLTAAHCTQSPYVRDAQVWFWDDGAELPPVTVSHAYVHPYADVTLLRLSTRLGRAYKYTNNFYDETAEDLVASQAELRCFGWGPDSLSGEDNLLRRGVRVRAAGIDAWSPDGIHTVKEVIIEPLSGDDRVTFPGDSGGPCFVQVGNQWRLIGLNATADQYASADDFRDWVWQHMSGWTAPTEVVLAQDTWWYGRTATLDAFHQSWDALWMFFPNDALTSLHVGSMARATIYRDADQSGTIATFTQSVSDLTSAAFNDEASSIKIENRSCGSTPGDNEVIVWQNANYTGACDRLAGNSLDELLSLNVQDGITSAKIGANVSLTLYDATGYRGTRVVLTANQPDLSAQGWNDRARSLRVNGRGCTPPSQYEVVLWSDDLFMGSCMNLTTGFYSGAAGMGINDNSLSSIQVGHRARASLYSGSSGNGAEYHLRHDHPRTRALVDALTTVGTMHDVVSSVRVRRRENCASPGARQVVVWEHSDYSGRCATLEVGSYGHWFTTAFDFNDNVVSSFEVGSEVKVILYDGIRFTGSSWTYTTSQPVLSSVNDRATSIKVQLK